MDIPINSLRDYIGLILLALGGFMILAGFDIISVHQVTVKQGRRTWAMGIAFALFGIFLLLPEFTTSTPTATSPTAITLSTTEILQPDQQAKCGILKLDAVNPPAVLENESREYKLIGSGFCNNTIITISGYAYVGNSPQSINSQPIEVSSDGTWLTVYINHVLDPDQSGGYITVENPDGNTASLYVNYQK
jgi:hypothetical protein